jgi:hypothetical protein
MKISIHELKEIAISFEKEINSMPVNVSGIVFCVPLNSSEYERLEVTR